MKKSENERKGLIVWLDGRMEGSLVGKEKREEKGVYNAKLSRESQNEKTKTKEKKHSNRLPTHHPTHAGFLIEESI